MRRVAGAYGWSPVPPERTLRRRIEREIPAAVRALARKGKDKAKTLYPAQRRTRAGLRAMQAVNTDGHRIDVFVRLPNARQPVRMHLLAIQDLYSGKIVAWRLAESENRVAVRLAIGDMVEAFGIPETVVFDNGRAFASKWITGGFPNRYRFKVRDEEPQGLVKSLGVTDIRWTTPYSGQSKPIERAFRDLAEEIAKHPCCDGAYVGNRPDAKPENYGTRAIPIDEFSEHVARTIGEHNARPGRDTETARGRSFDETFNESFAQAIVRWPTEAQRSLWLLAAERVSAQRVIAGARGSGTVPGAQVRPLDLDNLDSVRTFAGGDFGDGIDALVLNAGLQGYDLKAKTTQGFERTFGVNHLAHYLLLRLLLPQVKDGGIIVITSSGTHDPDEKTGVPPPRHAVTEMLAYPDRDPDVLESPMRAGRQAYSASKLCNLMTARTLAASPEAKARNLHVYAYDPGFTPGTSLARQSPWFVRAIWPLLPLFRPFMKGMNSLEAAGRGLLGIADGSITREGGVYCSLRGAKPTWPPPSEIARDKTACEKLWRDSAKMVGLPA
jgi:NAD(P)-dependent dehydrogenase (short-subunit alcohol dehydrogenase family)